MTAPTVGLRARARRPARRRRHSRGRATWRTSRGRAYGAGHDGYAKKHDPFVYYRALVRDPAMCGSVVPFTQLTADERAGEAAGSRWITPNLCHDMHDCDPAFGDRFLAAAVPPLLRALGPRGLLILTWDEGIERRRLLQSSRRAGTSSRSSPDSPREAGRAANAGVDHYGVLRTVENALGLGAARGRGGAAQRDARRAVHARALDTARPPLGARRQAGGSRAGGVRM